jgi:hypothetical protein
VFVLVVQLILLYLTRPLSLHVELPLKTLRPKISHALASMSEFTIVPLVSIYFGLMFKW